MLARRFAMLARRQYAPWAILGSNISLNSISLNSEATAMTKRTIDFPVFDADNHMYETEDAFTRYLPSKYTNAIKYVQVKGRTKNRHQRQDLRVHPQPDIRSRGRSRSTGRVLPFG